MVSAAVLIPLLIVAFTQFLKQAVPNIKGFVTVLVALLVGIVVALIDGFIGVTDITVAEGIVFALEAIGITILASKAGGGASGDATTTSTIR